MIIVNGHITICTITGGGQDTSGRPLPVVESWGVKIPCQWRITSANRRASDAEGNPYRAASYEIFINFQNGITTDAVRLYDGNGNLLAEGSAACIETLELMNVTRIVL